MANRSNFGMFPGELLTTDDPRIGAHEIAVYAALAWRAGKKADCFPSYDDIAALAKIGVRSAKRAVKNLEAAGFITVARRYEDGQRTSNRYRLPFLAPGDKPAGKKPAREDAPKPTADPPRRRHAPVDYIAPAPEPAGKYDPFSADYDPF